MKKLAVLIASAFVLTACSQGESVSYPVQTEEDVQNTQQTAEPSQNSTKSGTDLPDTQDVAENDDLGEPNQVEEDSRERAETDEPEVVDAPNVAEYALSREIVDDEICKLREDSYPRRTWADVSASGFPLNTYGSTLPRLGSANVKIIFLEWEDLQGTLSDYDYHVTELKRTAEFYRVMSEGKFRLNLSFESEWAVVGESYKDSYFTEDLTDAGHNSASAIQSRIDRFIDAVDETVDFSDVDILFFGLPRGETVIESGGLHIFGDGGWVSADTAEGSILNIFAFGERVIDHIGQNQGWAWFAHELGHSLKMPDLRDYSDGRVPDMNIVNPMYGFDIMDNQDSGTQGLSGWMKWLQGWLDDSQVTCIDAATVDSEYYRLDEVNLINADNEMLVVRLSDTKALIVESRRWDSRFDLPISESRDGVIVYRLDTTRGHEEGPLRLLSPRNIAQYLRQDNVWPDWRVLDVILFEGDSVSYEGVTVSMERLSDSGDIVRVSR